MIAAIRRRAAEAFARWGLRFATLAPDYFFPGSGCLLGAKLGVPGIAAFDVRNQCSGFLYGLTMADAFVRAGTYRRVLVVAGDISAAELRPLAEAKQQAIVADIQEDVVVVGDEDLTERFEVIGFPTYFLIDTDGRIFKKYVGEIKTMKVELERDIQNLLARRSTRP